MLVLSSILLYLKEKQVSEVMYKVNLNCFVNSVIICNRFLEIIDANDLALSCLGYSFEALTKKYFWELLEHKNEYFASQIFSIQKLGKIYEDEFITGDGSKITCAFTICKTYDELNNEQFLVCIQKNTEEQNKSKRLEEIIYLLRSVISINQAVIKKYELGRIFEQACFYFVNLSGFKFAIFLKIDYELSIWNFVTGFGEPQIICHLEQDGGLENLLCSLPRLFEAISYNQINIVNNLRQIENPSELVLKLLDNDVISIAYLPVAVDTNIFGILIIGSERGDYFDFDVLLILEESCNNLSFAVKDYLQDKKLMESEIKRKVFFERSPAGFAILDQDRRIIDVNNKFLELIRADREDTIGKIFSSIFPKDTGLDIDRIVQTLPEKRFEKFEILLNKNGKNIWLYCYLEFIEGFNYYSVVIFDETEQKELQIALDNEKRKSSESDKLKTYILQNISHEFRTPLSSILGFSKMIESFTNEPEIVENAHLIYDSGKRLYRTLESLVFASQLVSGFVKVRPDFVDLSILADECALEFLPIAKEKNLEFELRNNMSNSFFCSDIQLLKYIIFVLLDNAFKFTSEGSIQFVVNEKNIDGRRFVEFKVIDTGIGINDESKKLLFEMFRQGSEGISRQYEGLGLGLFNAKLVAQLLGGEIEIESEQGKGATFAVLLPELNCEDF